MEPRHHAGCRVPVVDDVLRLGASRRPRQPSQPRFVVGEQVRTSQPPELDAVLQEPLVAVRLGQLGAVLAPHVAMIDERGQGGQRRADPEPLVRPAVDQLQQLHGELCVAKASRAQLDLAIGLLGGDQRDHPRTHRLRLGDEPLALPHGPHERLDEVAELLAQRQVAGHGPGLEHRLELPVLRPLLVVRLHAGERPYQRPRLALGSQCRVDLPQRPGRGGVGTGAGRGGSQPRTDVDRLARRADGLAGGVERRLRHVQDVDVGDVVELLRAGLPQSQHREADPVVASDAAASDGDRGLQRRVGEVGQLAGDVLQHLEGVGRGEVPGCDPHHLPPVRVA